MWGSGACLRNTTVAALGKAVCVTSCTNTWMEYSNLKELSKGEKTTHTPLACNWYSHRWKWICFQILSEVRMQLAPAHFNLWNFLGVFFQTFSYVKVFCQGLLLPDDFWSDFIPMLVFNSHLAPDSTYFLIDLLPFCMHYGLFILLLFIGRSLIRLWALVMIFREQKYPWRNFINGK